MEKDKKPTVLVFAGPNGSGKSTFTNLVKPIGIYINADNIVTTTHCDNLTAAKQAEKLRNECVAKKVDFTFETVLSTPRNLELLQRAKEQGYFIKMFFVLTDSPLVNVARVKTRVSRGGHDVPKDKIISRYDRSLALLPELLKVCDVCNVYDNTAKIPKRIFSKKKDTYRLWETDFFSKERILDLTKFTGTLTTINSTREYLKKVVTAQELTSLQDAKIPVEVCQKDEKICIRFEKSLKEKVDAVLQQSASQRMKK